MHNGVQCLELQHIRKVVQGGSNGVFLGGDVKFMRAQNHPFWTLGACLWRIQVLLTCKRGKQGRGKETRAELT